MTAGEVPRVAHAFAPGHLTGIFSPALGAADPRERGSVGAGLVLDAGVAARAEWSPSARPSVQLSSDTRDRLPISSEVAWRLLSRRPGRLRVDLVHELPIGQGFGMSAAGALATALAVAPLAGHTTEHAIQVAHLADLFGGGGLGGVSAILGGGLELRDRPGVPPFGHVRHTVVTGTVFLVRAGRPIPSPALLRSPTFLRRIERAAERGLTRLDGRPSLPSFLRESERFTDALRLGPSLVLRLALRLRSPHIRVAQAMFGRSLFAVAAGPQARLKLVENVRRLGLSAVEVAIARRGGRQTSGRVVPSEKFDGTAGIGASPQTL